MANEGKKKRPTAEKRLIQSEKRRLINKAFKSKMRTAIRRFESVIAANETAAVQEALNSVYSLLDKGVKRGLVKLNKAGRDKSRLTALAASCTAA